MVAVIIPTYNGAHKLAGILNALAAQSFKEFGVIVAIDGSTDDTLSVLQYFKDQFNDFKFLKQENKGRAAVRNKGASYAPEGLLIFFDDDMRPEPDCIEQHLQHHMQHPHTLMSGSQIDDPAKASTPFQKYKSHLSHKWAEPLMEYEGKPLPLEKMHLTAANFSISKPIFLELGGFDESLKDNEDLDLAIRAYRKGYDIYYRHVAFAWHDDFPTCESFIKRQAEYITYHNYVAEHKKDIYSDISRFSKKPKQFSFFRRKFYWFWQASFWISLTDRRMLSFLPEKLQFKLYDWIVYSHLQIRKLRNGDIEA